ncbi:PREDICTED: RING-H2 finger protein ATL13 [Tarenaya hassleriana]|uniref:RING-H2 finger protein ATL13 n=1 Tax=Tarenaya hassleriana TaxID=28532 RepID=UPI00053C2F96|nr:PREDICTED: RING-H2 finger protein ATL13 [Tarenaya hassleriana]
MKFSRENMKWVFPEIKATQNFISPSPPLMIPPPPPIRPDTSFDLNSKISPSILLIIIILSIIFFISGLLHLLVRFLLSPSNRDRDDYFDNVTALQGQLQQLFHLHDSGVDQSFIDTLPVFHYKSIIGLKNHPFDCAVCLSEFESEDKLRLLPKCSHAFHMDCIDTWLLSHSTCPLCRSSLLSDFSSQYAPCSSYLLVLESGSDHSSREIAMDRDNASCAAGNEDTAGRNNSCLAPDSHSQSNPHLGFDGSLDLGSTHLDSGHKSGGIPLKSVATQVSDGEMTNSGEKVVPFAVKLGKFRNVDDVGEGSNDKNISDSSNVDERRCFSMGSYEYIMDEESALKVNVSAKKLSRKEPRLPGHRTAMSECGCDGKGVFRFSRTESMRITEEKEANGKGKGIEKNVVKRESFSVSKVWLRGKKEKQKAPREDCSLASSSRRAFSFRFPVQRSIPDGKNEAGSDEENQKSENSESLETKTPSFARRTMLWLAGRQNKVVHSSPASHV